MPGHGGFARCGYTLRVTSQTSYYSPEYTTPTQKKIIIIILHHERPSLETSNVAVIYKYSMCAPYTIRERLAERKL
jgi:hypothetical protein